MYVYTCIGTVYMYIHMYVCLIEYSRQQTVKPRSQKLTRACLYMEVYMYVYMEVYMYMYEVFPACIQFLNWAKLKKEQKLSKSHFPKFSALSVCVHVMA